MRATLSGPLQPDETRLAINLADLIGLRVNTLRDRQPETLFGAAVEFMFSGLAVNSGSRAAGPVVYEVRPSSATSRGFME
jgi:Na+/H+-translocating membrane pyrophosphatase